MSVVIETTLGDITVDVFTKTRPRASLNFLKLCKMKYYNYNLFHTISRGFIAQTGDPTGSRNGGESIFGVLEGPLKRYFQAEKTPRIKHTTMGLISFVGTDEEMLGSQFFFTLGEDLTYLDEQHCVFGEVTEGLDVLELLNEVICDQDNRPYQDVRITHTVILDDPFPDPKGLILPERSPSPSAERLQGGRIAPDEDIDETQGKSMQEINEIIADKEAKARAAILEMIGDIPDADMAPPENVLFVCKLNPVTTDDDLEIIFSRFGKIKSCEVIRDRKTGESLQYAFVEFEDEKSCETAYFKMDNVLIDDRRIHVDFSQSVAKIKWHGKGRGVTTYDDKGRSIDDRRNDFGNGRYQRNKDGGQSGRPRHDNDRPRHDNDRPRHENDRSRREYDRRHDYDRIVERKYDRNASYDVKTQRRRSRSSSRSRKMQDNRPENYRRHRERYSTSSHDVRRYDQQAYRRDDNRYDERRNDEGRKAPKERLPNDRSPKEGFPKERPPKERSLKERPPKERSPKDKLPKERSLKDRTGKERSPKDSRPHNVAKNSDRNKDNTSKDNKRRHKSESTEDSCSSSSEEESSDEKYHKSKRSKCGKKDTKQDSKQKNLKQKDSKQKDSKKKKSKKKRSRSSS